MARIVLIGEDSTSKGTYLASRPLPNFYMNDFSIQGITVGDFPAACRLLAQSGYTILDKYGGADIIFNDIKQLASVLSLLRLHGIQSELGDIADTIYQA